MNATPFDNQAEGEEDARMEEERGVRHTTDCTCVECAEDTARRIDLAREARCKDDVEHYVIQGSCWYCARTQAELDARSEANPQAVGNEHAAECRCTECRVLDTVFDGLVGGAPVELTPPSTAASEAMKPTSTGGETPGEEQPGARATARAHASASDHSRSGQFVRGNTAGSKQDRRQVARRSGGELLTAKQRKADAERLHTIIQRGEHREAVAAFKLLYGQPPASKDTPTVPPTARLAPGVELPAPPELTYGRTG